MSNEFFKTRWQLVKGRKYRDYITIALGELILLVFGIFIALQIDNWNQDRQEKKIIDAYLVLISKDLQSDIQSIEELMENRKQALIYTDSILSYYRNGYIANSKLFERGYFSLFIETRFHPNTTAFESLKNSGFMKNLENLEIEEQLNQYHQLIENISFVEDKFINMTQPVENSLVLKGFYSEYNQIFKWQNRDSVIFTIQSMNKYPEFEAAFIKAKMFQEELINNYKGLLLNGHETLKLINNGD